MLPAPRSFRHDFTAAQIDEAGMLQKARTVRYFDGDEDERVLLGGAVQSSMSG